MAELDDRINSLEKTLARLTGGAIVAGVLVLGWMGYASWHQIPNAAKNVVQNAVEEYVEKIRPGIIKHIKGFENEAKQAESVANELKALLEKAQGKLIRIESGDINIDKNKFPKLVGDHKCKEGPEGYRGAKSQRVNFKKPFSKKPEVVLALRKIDSLKGKNFRLLVTVTQKDLIGFTYDFETWCDSEIDRASAQWIAFGY